MKNRVSHLSRYKDIAKLAWKYGRSDWVRHMALDEEFSKDAENAPAGEATPDQLADDLEAMGPTFVKLGQVLSSRPDLLPEPYIRALARLQDDVKPFPYEDARRIVEAELGAKISNAFSRFDEAPIAGASLGQVHSAALRDGREVVVKVQRPDVREQILEDFDILAEAARLLDAHTEFGRRHRLGETLQEVRTTILQELDYEREARNLVAMATNLGEFDLIRVPQPIGDYCSSRVLTMEYVSGSKITRLSPLARLDFDGSELAEALFRAYLKQVLVDGLFHADPHPGNVFITDDRRIALLDLGMVGHTTPDMQNNLLKILIALGEGRAEEVSGLIAQMSSRDEDFDSAAFNRRIAQIMVERQGQSLRRTNVGSTLLQLTRCSAESGVYVPSELTMLGKTLLQLDEVGRILDPEFDPDAAIRRNSADIMSRRLSKDASKGSFFTSLLDMKNFAAGLPVRLNKILDTLASPDLEVRVRAVDAPVIIEGLLKIANRIASGLILAALIIGASLMMRIETSWTIFGYPGLAILCFLGAAAGGVYLLMSIFIQDRRSERRARRTAPR